MSKLFKAILTSFVMTTSISAISAPQVIGEYANGCIDGAVPLPRTGANYQVQIWGQGRNYGHPELIDYLEKLVAKAHHYKLPDLLIGDMSQKYGGSFGKSSSHGSHQSGLDVDISFDFATPKKTVYELSHPKDVNLVDGKNKITKNFTKNHVALLYLAAQDPRVERIFVAPGIKKVLCDVYKNKDRSWLQKYRPWFGHRAHMHVRLACPLGNSLCVKQAKVPPGDGCGAELESWLNPPPQKSTTSKQKKKVQKVIPPQCVALFKAHR